MLSFFADEFAKFNFDEKSDYKLSTYYTERAFNLIDGCNVEPVDGIMYPSIPHSYEKMNIALLPDVITSGKLKFVSAMQVWITDPAGKRNATQFIPIIQRVSADENGLLQWPGTKQG